MLDQDSDKSGKIGFNFIETQTALFMKRTWPYRTYPPVLTSRQNDSDLTKTDHKKIAGISEIKKLLSTMRKLPFILLLLNISPYLYAQTSILPTVIQPSPQSQEFQRYGDYPVSCFTGTTKIEIPLHSVKYYGYELPISLKYHSAGIKAGECTDTYGLGWTLFCGGEISRIVNGSPDEQHEFKKRLSRELTHQRPYPYDMMMDMTRNAPWGDDLAYDQFSVTLPDGTFFKFYIYDEYGQLKAYTDPYGLPVRITFDKRINNFEITDEHGVKYYFSAKEYYSNGYKIKMTWKLIKITLPKSKKEILFRYESFLPHTIRVKNYTRILRDSIGKMYPCESAFLKHFHTILSSYQDFPFPPEDVYETPYRQRTYDGVMLKCVSFGSDSIKLNYDYYQNTTACQYKLASIMTEKEEKKITFKMHWFNETEKIAKLNNVIIADNRNQSEFSKYEFGYIEDLVTLDKHTSYDHWGYIYPANRHVDEPNLVRYYDCHVGYPYEIITYNLPNFVVELGSYVNQRDTCMYNVWYGSMRTPHYSTKLGNAERTPRATPVAGLNRITYPTGGYTVFEYESNQYEDKDHWAEMSPGGGYRIKSIKNYSNGKLTQQKNYKYGVNECGYGYAAVKPTVETYARVYINWFHQCPGPRPMESDLPERCRLRERHFTSDHFTMLLGSCPPVVYSEVTEYLGDDTNNSGKIVYKYRIGDHYLPRLKYNDDKQYYFVMNEAQWYGGQLLGKSIFQKSEGKYILQQRVRNTWDYSIRHTLGDELNFYQYDLFDFYKVHPDYLGQTPYLNQELDENAFYADEHMIHLGNANLVSSITTDYFETDSVVKADYFQYSDPGNFITIKSTTHSTGESYIQRYWYPQHKIAIYGLSTETENTRALDSLIAQNIVAPVIQEEVYFSSTLLSMQRNDYALFGTNVFLQSQNYKYTTHPWEKRVKFESYDKFGNPQEITKDDLTSTVYLWGYCLQYPIAEIQNATYKDIVRILGEVFIDRIGSAVVPTEEDLATLNGLRHHDSLKNSLITTYTYKPLVGILSKTNSRGITIQYDYDNLGRLIRISECNPATTLPTVLESYRYHFKNQ